MLARTFKTAAELRMEPHEYNALVTVLYMIEDGTIPLEKIFMRSFHCGTRHCLAGWANVIDKNAFPETSTVSNGISHRMTPELKYLFGIDHSPMHSATPIVATTALRAFLETGECPRL